MFNVDNFLHDEALPASARWTGFPLYNFIGGHNDEDLIPIEKLEEASKKVILNHGHTLGKYNYTGPLGYLPLRKFIIKKLLNGASMTCSEDEILVVSGSLQALDLVNETFLKPGDTVIIEEGSYGGVFSRLEKLGINIKGIPVEDDGMNINLLSECLEDLKATNIVPRYIYTIPTIQNPTGTIMSKEKRIKLIELAKNRSGSNSNIEYFSGDMKEESFGNFDYIIAMDSLIHYSTEDVIRSIADFSKRANNSVLFTVIPSTFALRTKLRLGKYFPKSERSPEVVPIDWGKLHQLEAHGVKASLSKVKRIKSFFYVSEAWELATI